MMSIEQTFGFKPYLAIPTGINGIVHFECMFGGIDCFREFGVAPNIRRGQHIEESRDVLAAQFLSSDSSHMLLVSPEIGWRATHVRQLLEAEKDVVSGTYHPSDGRVVACIEDPEPHSQGQIVRCSVIPAEFLLVTRKAILQLMWESPNAHYVVPDVGRVHALWTSTVMGQRDEQAFSARCRAAGLTIWMHTGVVLSQPLAAG